MIPSINTKSEGLIPNLYVPSYRNDQVSVEYTMLFLFCCINLILGEFYLWELYCSFHMTEIFWKFSSGTKHTITEHRNERWKLSDRSWFRTVPFHKWKFITAILQYLRKIKLTGSSSSKNDQFENVGEEFIYPHKP